ncbi:MAG: hypothetical protein K8T10_06465 [Candidatus Eremiobacteraeota bacterium]|nr:hypothetical protein [Candidatus Eremiobacteraeota bacterium]
MFPVKNIYYYSDPTIMSFLHEAFPRSERSISRKRVAHAVIPSRSLPSSGAKGSRTGSERKKIILLYSINPGKNVFYLLPMSSTAKDLLSRVLLTTIILINTCSSMPRGLRFFAVLILVDQGNPVFEKIIEVKLFSRDPLRMTCSSLS